MEDSDDDAPMEDSEAEESKLNLRGCGFATYPVLSIIVGGYKLNVLNSLRPIALKVDEACLQFLKGVVLPELEKKAHSQSAGPVTPVKKAPFNFSDEDPLLLAARVAWRPSTRSYTLVLRGPGAQSQSDCTDHDGNLLSVDPKLTGERFYEAKEAVYRRACAARHGMSATIPAARVYPNAKFRAVRAVTVLRAPSHRASAHRARAHKGSVS